MGLGRRLPGVILLLLLVAGGTAVFVMRDDGAGPGENADVVALAATRMGEVTSYRTEMRTELARGEDESPSSIVFRGAIDIAGERFRWVGSLPPDNEIESMMIGGMQYTKVRAASDDPRITTPWIAYPAHANPSAAGSIPLAADLLDRLRAAAGRDVEAEFVREDEIRGAPTRGYRLELRGDDARRYAAATMRDDADEPPAGFSLDFVIWVDGDGLMRRVDMSTSGSGTPLMFVVEYFDFGVELPPIEPPPDDQVTFFDSREEYETRAHRKP
jgi:hypothetical protein